MKSAMILSIWTFLIGPIWAPIFAQQVAGPTAVHAVVRQPSHGASATVIWTGQGKSYILGCGHAYPDEQAKRKKIGLDVPTPNPSATPKEARPKLIALFFNGGNPDADLSLIELPDGPLAYVMPVAPEGFKPGANTRSAGYDGMKLPGVNVATHIVSFGAPTLTREQPIPGRSGGALFDADKGYLIGVCTGYEVLPRGRGIWVRHSAIVAFLKREGYGWLIPPGDPVGPPPGPLGVPKSLPYYGPYQGENLYNRSPGNCPT